MDWQYRGGGFSLWGHAGYIEASKSVLLRYWQGRTYTSINSRCSTRYSHVDNPLILTHCNRCWPFFPPVVATIIIKISVFLRDYSAYTVHRWQPPGKTVLHGEGSLLRFCIKIIASHLMYPWLCVFLAHFIRFSTQENLVDLVAASAS